MSLQRNLLIGAGTLGAIMILANVASAETPQKVVGGDDPSYLSVVNPYGINPATGNTYCEDYENCPDDGFGEEEKMKKEETSSDVKNEVVNPQITATYRDNPSRQYEKRNIGKVWWETWNTTRIINEYKIGIITYREAYDALEQVHGWSNNDITESLDAEGINSSQSYMSEFF